MRQKTNFNINKFNQKGRWLRKVIQDLSDEELVIFTPPLNSEVIFNVKKKTSEIRLAVLAEN